MRVELLKFVVQPVLVERDDDNIIVGERVGEPTAVYTDSQLIEFVDTVRAEVTKANLVVVNQ
jgi:hypothetical protein